MRTMLFAVGVVATLSACATTPPTAWGKPGVSKADFGNDIGMCTGMASQANVGSGENKAGGVSGRNTTPSGGAANAGGGAGTPAGGTYQGMASGDYAARAATQQLTQEMAIKRAQAEAYAGCLTERGYLEFVLTAEQAAKLASFKIGSNEYYEYLYSVSSDPSVAGKAKSPTK
jgi:hypothetical protein